MMHESLPQKLRVLRAQKGWTLTEAARRAGVGRDTLSDLERGRQHPVMPTLTKIARGYGVPTEDLLIEEEEPALAGKAEAPPGGPASEVGVLHSTRGIGPWRPGYTTGGIRATTRMLSREEVVNRMILAEKSEDAAQDIINSIADSQVPVSRDTYKRIARQRLAEIADHEPQTLMDKRAERRLLALIEALNNPDAMTPYRIKQLVSEDVG